MSDKTLIKIKEYILIQFLMPFHPKPIQMESNIKTFIVAASNLYRNLPLIAVNLQLFE